jgi:hypothetical protein
MYDPTARCANCGKRQKCTCQECVFCGEIVRSGEASQALVNDREVHYECALRQVIGSVAHLQQTCSCYVPGAVETDPPGMTKRQAASAATFLWHQQQGDPHEV